MLGIKASLHLILLRFPEQISDSGKGETDAVLTLLALSEADSNIEDRLPIELNIRKFFNDSYGIIKPTPSLVVLVILVIYALLPLGLWRGWKVL